VIGVGGALAYLGDGGAGLLATGPELRAVAGEIRDAATMKDDTAGPAGNDAAETPRAGLVLASDEDARAAIEPDSEFPSESHGILANAVTDSAHWLAAGLPGRVRFMYQGDRVYAPLRLDQGVNVLTWAADAELVAGGYLPEATRRQLARKPAVMVQPQGRGMVIGFVADPAFRGMLDGVDVLLANAVFFAPAQANPVPMRAWRGRTD